MATEAATQPATQEKKTGLLLPCPRCGEAEAVIRLDLADLDTLYCCSCEVEFSLDEIRAIIGTWSKVVAWVETFPQE